MMNKIRREKSTREVLRQRRCDDEQNKQEKSARKSDETKANAMVSKIRGGGRKSTL